MEPLVSSNLICSTPLKFALIGCGGIATKHADAISRNPHSRLVAIADKDPARGANFATRYAVPWYDDYQEMLEKEDIDVAVVLTPSGTHAEIAITSMRCGKHVVVEKPLALRVEDARRVADEACLTGKQAFVVHQNRYNPPIQRLWQSICSGRLGRIVLASARVHWCRPQSYYDQATWRGTWQFDGGVFANQAVHNIDLLLWLAGSLDSVFATGARAMANIEAEDLGIAIMRFSSGAIGSIEATTCARPHDLESSISILGEKGSVEIAGTQLDRVQLWKFETPEEGDEEFVQAFSTSPNAASKTGHLHFYDALVHCLMTGSIGCLPTVEDGYKSIEALNAIYSSMQQSVEVNLSNGLVGSKLGQRSMHAGNIQSLPEREDWAGSSDRGLLFSGGAA